MSLLSVNTFTFRAISIHCCPKQLTIRTFVTRQKPQHITVDRVRMKKKMLYGSRWNLNKWVFWGKWRLTLLSWQWLGVCSTTEAPKQRRFVTSLSNLCLLSAMAVNTWFCCLIFNEKRSAVRIFLISLSIINFPYLFINYQFQTLCRHSVWNWW